MDRTVLPDSGSPSPTYYRPARHAKRSHTSGSNMENNLAAKEEREENRTVVIGILSEWLGRPATQTDIRIYAERFGGLNG